MFVHIVELPLFPVHSSQTLHVSLNLFKREVSGPEIDRTHSMKTSIRMTSSQRLASRNRSLSRSCSIRMHAPWNIPVLEAVGSNERPMILSRRPAFSDSLRTTSVIRCPVPLRARGTPSNCSCPSPVTSTSMRFWTSWSPLMAGRSFPSRRRSRWSGVARVLPSCLASASRPEPGTLERCSATEPDHSLGLPSPILAQ